MEHILNIMTSFCDSYGVISDTQYGFRLGKSTITLLEDFSDHLYEALDSNNFVLVLFIDLKKAFDTIDHARLVKKLGSVGFGGPFENFITDYFSNRFQFVKIKENQSQKAHVHYGVPQGASLSPMLFNTYMTDLSLLGLRGKLFQYADDTAIVFEQSDIGKAYNMLQEDIEN